MKDTMNDLLVKRFEQHYWFSSHYDHQNKTEVGGEHSSGSTEWTVGVKELRKLPGKEDG